LRPAVGRLRGGQLNTGGRPDVISVIIPTRNEARIIKETLRALFQHPGEFEIIVADGESTDDTLQILEEFPGIKKVTSPPGRGKQMNAGARAAAGDILMFLHADSLLPPRAFGAIEQALSNPGVSGGCFTLQFDDPRLFFRILAAFSRLNHIFSTYGDQGLFLRAETFRALGGFRDLPVMEDVEIQKRIRAAGRFVKIPRPIVTSARRYRQKGPWRQHLQTTLIVVGYHLGVPPRFLARCYYGRKR
jgi:rSAM/selenodomain-associated transferase 2